MEPVEYWIDHLNLQPLEPEGGYFNQVFISKTNLSRTSLPDQFKSDRRLVSSIFYLLTSKEYSHFHRMKADEIWAFHYGSSITIHQIDAKGTYAPIKLGLELEANEVPQAVVKAGTIFGATVNEPNSYTLVGCMVAPGFTFEDFEMVHRAELLPVYPELENVIIKLTHDE